MSSTTLAAGPSEFNGRSPRFDDELFAGCYHNAFEGEIVQNDDGTVKMGSQGIRRTKGVLSGAGSNHDTMTLTFELAQAPATAVGLTIRGIDDRFEPVNQLAVLVNDQRLADEVAFENNQNIALGLNQRYFPNWTDVRVSIPAKTLRKGENTLRIANESSVFESDRWNYAVIDYVDMEFTEETTVSVTPPTTPVFYYGLNEGAEVNLWPAINIANRVCLVTEGVIEFNFFVTMPGARPLGTQGPLAGQGARPKRDILIHFETAGDVTVVERDGTPVPSQKVDDGVRFTKKVPRLVKYETPHPAQGVVVFMQGDRPFEDRSLKAWCSIDGVDYRARTYPLRCVSIRPVEGIDQLEFTMGIWGGQIPADAEARQKYIDLVGNAGFRQLFTGNTPDLNRALKESGFSVYPRYGWFGHQFKVDESTAQYAAIDAKGDPLPKDFCPIAILENDDHPQLGRFFRIAREMSAQDGIDGLCVDYETGAVWCWCAERCLKKFAEETGHTIADRAKISGDGPLAAEYRDFGRRRNRDLLTRVKEIMQEVQPGLEYHSLASASDIPMYWYDGRGGGRHAARELVKFADAIYASVYCYELPGGVKSVGPIVNTIRKYGVDAGRPVGASVISPIATTVSEVPRYRAARMRPDLTRLMALSTALHGGRGLLLFRGDCFDGEYYLSCRQAVDELLRVNDYLQARLDRSYELDVAPLNISERRISSEMAQNLLSRLVWRPDPSYLYDGVQLLRDPSGDDRLITLFNYSSEPAEFQVRVRGLFDPWYKLHGVGAEAPERRMSRIDIEGGELVIEVPARDCVMLKLVSEGGAK